MDFGKNKKSKIVLDLDDVDYLEHLTEEENEAIVRALEEDEILELEEYYAN